MDWVRQSPVLPFKGSFYVGIRLLLMKFKLIRGNQKPPIRLQIDFLVICHFPVWSRRFHGELVRSLAAPGPGLGTRGRSARPPAHAEAVLTLPPPRQAGSRKVGPPGVGAVQLGIQPSRSLATVVSFGSHPRPEAARCRAPTEPRGAPGCGHGAYSPARRGSVGRSCSAVRSQRTCSPLRRPVLPAGESRDLPHSPATHRGHVGPPPASRQPPGALPTHPDGPELEDKVPPGRPPHPPHTGGPWSRPKGPAAVGPPSSLGLERFVPAGKLALGAEAGGKRTSFPTPDGPRWKRRSPKQPGSAPLLRAADERGAPPAPAGPHGGVWALRSHHHLGRSQELSWSRPRPPPRGQNCSWERGVTAQVRGLERPGRVPGGASACEPGVLPTDGGLSGRQGPEETDRPHGVGATAPWAGSS